MCGYRIKQMENEEEMNGKAYVHYKSWQETYTDLVDAEYLESTLPEYGEIFALYVLEAYHRKKICYALMNAAFEKLSAYKKNRPLGAERQ